MKCHLIDALPQPGGQCSEIYPKKPIYDIPGFPEVLAGDLVDNLMEQIKPFEPGFTLGERAETIEKQEDGSFIVTTNKGTSHQAPVVVIAGGLGSFEPRKPPIKGIQDYEDKGVAYIIRDPEVYRDKKSGYCRRRRFRTGLEHLSGRCGKGSFASTSKKRFPRSFRFRRKGGRIIKNR